jgi:hypothetical protein
MYYFKHDDIMEGNLAAILFWVGMESFTVDGHHSKFMLVVQWEVLKSVL